MLLEVVKKDNCFIIPELEKMSIDKDRFQLEISDDSFESATGIKITKKSKTYQMLERLSEKLDDDEFVKLKLRHTPMNYEYKDNGNTDDELWYEAVKEKYEL